MIAILYVVTGHVAVILYVVEMSCGGNVMWQPFSMWGTGHVAAMLYVVEMSCGGKCVCGEHVVW